MMYCNALHEFIKGEFDVADSSITCKVYAPFFSVDLNMRGTIKASER